MSQASVPPLLRAAFKLLLAKYDDLADGFKDTIIFNSQCPTLNSKARELVDYSIKHNLQDLCFDENDTKFNSFLQLVYHHVHNLYQIRSLSESNFPFQAAVIVVLLSIVGTLQKDLRGPTMTVLRQAGDNTSIRIRHYYLCIQRILLFATQFYYVFFHAAKDDPSSFSDPQSFDGRAVVDVDKRFDSIPSLIFQLRFYTLMCRYDLNGKCTKEWFDKYYQFYQQFKMNYFDNKNYNPNKYEKYLRKYFQPEFDISFYLFTLMEYIIFKSYEILDVNYYKKQQNLLQSIKSSTKKIRTLEKVHKSCFDHCLDQRFYLMKDYNPLLQRSRINPLYAFLYNVIDIDCMILYGNENAAISSLVRSRVRVSLHYHIRLVLHGLAKEKHNYKQVNYVYYMELFYAYYKFVELCLLYIPLNRLMSSNINISNSVYSRLCNYVTRFILSPALKSETNYKLWAQYKEPADQYADKITRLHKIIIWCYFLMGNNDKCRKYFQLLEAHANHGLPGNARWVSVMEVLTMFNDFDTIKLYNILHKKRHNSKKNQKRNNDYNKSICSESQRLTLFRRLVSHTSSQTQQGWANIVKQKQYNLVENVLKQDIGHHNYIGWRNVALQKQCQSCNKKNALLKKCKGCKVAVYCSKRCQTRHWVSKHKFQCRNR